MNPDWRRARANSGGAWNAKHDDDGAPPHFDAVASVSVPSRFAKTTSPWRADAHLAHVRPGRGGQGGRHPEHRVADRGDRDGAVRRLGRRRRCRGRGRRLGARGRAVARPGLAARPRREARRGGDTGGHRRPQARATASATRRWRRPRRRAESRPSCAPKSSNGHLSSPTVTLEQRILDEVAAGREELVELTSTLIGFDTTAREPGDPARAGGRPPGLPRRAAGPGGRRRRHLGARPRPTSPARARSRRAWRSTAARSWPPASRAPAAGRACF